jgi:hypothetical protein
MTISLISFRISTLNIMIFYKAELTMKTVSITVPKVNTLSLCSIGACIITTLNVVTLT